MNDELVNVVFTQIITKYWQHLWDVVDEKPELLQTIPAFLLNPEQIIIYLNKTHLAIEYFGLEATSNITKPEGVSVVLYDYTSERHLIDNIIGFSHDGSSGIRLPLSAIVEDIYDPTNRALDELRKNGWNFFTDDMMFSINSSGYQFIEGENARIVNSFFYDANENGLIVRHIKWLDVFPINIENEDEDKFQFTLNPGNIEEQAVIDAHYTLRKPPDFQRDKLRVLNRFIELFSQADVKETEITRFLTQPEHQFILKMAFFGKNVYAEKQFTWAEGERKEIRPDFLVEQPNGLSDIVEFKLPTHKGSTVVGTENRETFGSFLHSYIAQTRVYSEYFEDPRNRQLVLSEHGINVLYPRRYVVFGRRWMFSHEEWRKIEHDYKNVVIRTYDDIVDGVRSQLYS